MSCCHMTGKTFLAKHSFFDSVLLFFAFRHPFTGRMTGVSNGSGFIVAENGVILTNAHVVANKQSVIVKLHDGRSFQGAVQAVDPVSDLATVKINGVGNCF